jgi:hypothetical protein
MMTDNSRPRWFFYPAWVALSAICIPVAWAVVWVIISQVVRTVGDTIQVDGCTLITEDLLFSYIFFPAIGLVTGFLQSLLLRLYLPRMRWWIAATTLGLLMSLVGSRLLSRALYDTLDSTRAGMLLTTLTGGSIGLAQWLVLQQRVRHSALWILANTLGWGVVGWVGPTLSNQMIIPAVGLLLVPGIATSIALWLLLGRLPRREVSGRN